MHGGRADGECWNCGHEQTVVYGGDNMELTECDNCGSVIAESNRFVLAWAGDKEDAESFKRRTGEKSIIQRIQERLSW